MADVVAREYDKTKAAEAGWWKLELLTFAVMAVNRLVVGVAGTAVETWKYVA